MNDQCREHVDELTQKLFKEDLYALFEENYTAAQAAIAVLAIQGVMARPEYDQYLNRLHSARSHRDALRHRQVRMNQL